MINFPAADTLAYGLCAAVIVLLLALTALALTEPLGQDDEPEP